MLTPFIVSYVAQADVLHHLRINIALPDHLLQDLEDQTVERRVLEAALPGLA